MTFTSAFPDMASNAEIEKIGELVISKPHSRKELAAMLQKAFDRLPSDTS